MYNELIIDLASIVFNYKFLSGLSKANCGAVLKANAYGLGMERIALCLLETGCQHFFVAYIDEAVTLRELFRQSLKGNFSKAPYIYVLNGPYFKGWENTFFHYNLIPIINSIDTLNEALDTQIQFGLHIDTGMHRLGISFERLNCFLQSKKIQPCVVLSHLTSSEDFFNPNNAHQLKRFLMLKNHFPSSLFSLCNSEGIFLGDDYHFDLLRPGLSLYGISTGTSVQALNLSFPLTASSTILAIQDVKKGESVGYNQTFIAESDIRVATLSCGYADGIPYRLGLYNTEDVSLKDKAGVYIHEEFAPILGKVSMDLLTVDVTNIKDAKVLDKAILFSKEHSIDKWSQKTEQSHYELLLHLGDRFKRTYKEI